MINVPSDKPFVPQITPKEIKQSQPAEETQPSKPAIPIPKDAQIGRGPELDSQAIAVRLAVMATDAKDKELKFEQIIQRVIDMTGLTNAQAAMEEVNRRMQQEIEETLNEIKSNKDLMEEAEAWQTFADVLEKKLSPEQLEAFFGIIRETINLMGKSK